MRRTTRPKLPTRSVSAYSARSQVYRLLKESGRAVPFNEIVLRLRISEAQVRAALTSLRRRGLVAMRKQISLNQTVNGYFVPSKTF